MRQASGALRMKPLVLAKIPIRMLREELMRRILRGLRDDEVEAELRRRSSTRADDEAKKLKELRVLHWGSQKLAAADLGISQSTLNWAESGGRPATTYRILTLARKKIDERE